jgi:DNA-binding NtrC family response regulator
MKRSGARILVIDDERFICVSCRRILEADGHTVDAECSAIAGVKKAVERDYDIILLDLKMPELSGMEALAQIKAKRPDLMVVIITGYATIQTSIEAIKKGAHNYVPKPFTPEELSLAVDKALEDMQVRSENAYLKQELSRMNKDMEILGRSDSVEAIRRQILKVAPTNFTVMIHGESGTGKDLIARAVHENSLRADKPYVAVDISSLSPNLVESELFGHVKGAFTGATQRRPGYFAIANGGSLFLDEISNVSIEVQGKLLRALEARTVRSVGSELEQEIDVRIIVATNRELHKMVEAGKFREDLYYRLNVIPIHVVPLREKIEDVPLLAMHFLRSALKDANTPCQGFSTGAMAKMMAYSWPGNVRELKNIVRRLVATVDDELIKSEHLSAEILGHQAELAGLEATETPKSTEELKRMKRRLKEAVYTKIERAFLLDALKNASWNVSQAARDVGMQRTNFHAMMRKYGLKSISD